MNRKGFTLIELLAVIVILAIIALIAVPIVLNIVKDSQTQSNKRSAELYLKGVELAIARQNLTDEFANATCEVQSNGYLLCTGIPDPIKVDVEHPATGGSITIQNGKITSVDNLKISNNYYSLDNSGLTQVPYLAPGLYDENDNLIASWDVLESQYGLDVETDYTAYSYIGITITPSRVFGNEDLITGVKLIIPDSVTSIGDWAFYNCGNLNSIILPNDLTEIGANAFNESSLTSIIIPSNVTTIGNGAFSNSSSLTSVTIPDSVISIGQSVFFQTGLTSVTIPSNVTSIGDHAFSTNSLISVSFENPNEWSLFFPMTSSTYYPTELELSDSSIAATYLKDTYVNYTWTRNVE